MYSDPKFIKKHRHMLSLDDNEQAIVESLAMYQGQAPATILRQLAILRASEILAAHHEQSVTRSAA